MSELRHAKALPRQDISAAHSHRALGMGPDIERSFAITYSIISLYANDINYPRYVKVGRKVFPVLMGKIVGLPDRPEVEVWCPNCEQHHYHGYNADDPEPGSGHRAAHCPDRIYEPGRKHPRIISEEFRRTGYHIIMPGQRLRDLMRFEVYKTEVDPESIETEGRR